MGEALEALWRPWFVLFYSDKLALLPFKSTSYTSYTYTLFAREHLGAPRFSWAGAWAPSYIFLLICPFSYNFTSRAPSAFIMILEPVLYLSCLSLFRHFYLSFSLFLFSFFMRGEGPIFLRGAPIFQILGGPGQLQLTKLTLISATAYQLSAAEEC